MDIRRFRFSEKGAMDEYPWFPFYAADFTNSKKVRLMKPEEVGVYVLLLAHEWQTGPITEAPDELFMFTQGADANTVEAVLERCFTKTGDGWVNERLEEVRGEQVKKREQKVRAGKASAKARRRNKIEQRSNGVAVSLPTKSNESESDTE